MNKKVIISNHYILNNNYNKTQLNINEFGYNHHKSLEVKLKKYININNICKYSSIKENNEINLKNKIIKYLDNTINYNNIVLSNSGDVNILSIYRLFKNAKSIIFTPTYDQYYNIGSIELDNVISISIGLNSLIDVHKLMNLINKNKIEFNNNICFICNPNNPTGVIWTLEALLYLFKMYTNTIFVIDETYIDFSKLYDNSIKSMVEYVNTYNNIIIMRSFSKAFGLAGLRLSYLVSNPIIIQNISKLISHKDVIELSKYAGNIILNNINFYKKQINKMFNDKQKLIEFCDSFNIKYLNSKTNFICIYIGKNVSKIVNIFKKINILIKQFNNTSLLNQYIRLTIQNNSINKVIYILKKYYYLIDSTEFNIGFIDGCFDGYHYGHIMSLYNAKSKSKKLICGIHTNQEIWNHKQKIPIFNYNDRFEILKYSIFIDELIDDTPYKTNEQIINNHNADKFFHGSDNISVEPLYSLDKKNLLVSYPRTKFISSTTLLKRIQYYKNNEINKITYGNKIYLNCLYSKIKSYIKSQKSYRNISIDINNLILININFDLFSIKHINFINLVKKKNPNYLIYIDLITNSKQYIIYSIDEIKLILRSIKLIDEIIVSNQELNLLKQKINNYNYNYIQINTTLLGNNYIDNTYYQYINKFQINNLL